MADQNIKAIKFKRTSTENKAPGVDALMRGEIALNTHGKTLAIYTKDEADKIVQLAGKGVTFLDTSGSLTVAGATTLGDTITVAKEKSLNFTTEDLSGEVVRHINGKCASNDGWYIGSGGTSNNGFLEIGTTDDGNEPIYFVQRGANNVLARKLTLLDGNGNTSIPGELMIPNGKRLLIADNSGNNKFSAGVGNTDVWIRNMKNGTSAILQLKDTGNITFNDKQVYYSDEGFGPGKGGTLLTKVENNRQAWQYVLSAATAGSARWVKIATMKNPGDASSQLDLMIAGGIDSGHGKHSVDFITLSGRNIASWNTNNLDNWVEWRRVGQPNSGNSPEYYVVKSDTSFDFYAKMPRYGNNLHITVLSTSGYNGKADGTVIIHESGNDTGANAPTGNILVKMKQIFDSAAKPDFGDTTGTLPVNRGGTGATNAGDARNNLGLKTAAVRDVGENDGNVLLRGAFGLGGTTGAGNISKGSLSETIKYLNTRGTCFFRVEDNVDSLGQYSPSIYVKTGSNQLVLSADHRTGIITSITTDKTDGTNLAVAQLYSTTNKPLANDNDFVSKAKGGTFGGNITVSGKLSTRSLAVSGEGQNFTPDQQGAWISWNKENGKGRTDFVNHRSNTASVEGGFDFWNYEGNNSAFKRLAQINNQGDIIATRYLRAGTALYGNDGNITQGSKFGGNLDNYLTAMKNDITSSNGNANNRVLKAGDTMTGRLSINMSDNSSGLNALYIKGSQHTPLVLERDTDANLSISFRLTGTNPVLQRKLGLAKDGTLHWGTADNQTENPIVLTQDVVNANITELKGGYRGSEVGIDLSPWTGSINDLFIGNNKDIGTRRMWYCPTMGAGDGITGVPAGKGNFILYCESLRAAEAVDYKNKQTFISGDTNKTYVRYGVGSGTAAAPKMNWGGWNIVQEFGNGVTPIANGGTNSTSVDGARNNLGLGTAQDVQFRGIFTSANGNIGIQTAAPNGDNATIAFKSGARIREGQGGGMGALIISASPDAATAKYVSLSPFGDSSAKRLLVKGSAANEVSLEFSDGGVIRNNSAGALILAAKSGQALHIRPNGDTDAGELQVRPSEVFSKTRINASEDNTSIILGKNSDLALVKKNGQAGKVTVGSGTPFVVAKSSGTAISSNIATERLTDIFSVQPSGDARVYRNLQVDGTSTSTGNINANADLIVKGNTRMTGVLNADGNINLASGKFVIAGQAPTADSHLTNKKYVDQAVKGAIDGAGDTYLPLAGGTLTGKLIASADVDVTGSQLKAKSLWVTGNTALNGDVNIGKGLLAEGNIQANGGNFTCRAENTTSNMNYWFRNSTGAERGVIWVNGQNGDLSLRNGGSREVVWRSDGWLQMAHSNPDGDGRAQTNGIKMVLGDINCDEHVRWEANQFVERAWHFTNAGGVDQWMRIRDTGFIFEGSRGDGSFSGNLTAGGNGSFTDVLIRSDRRVKHNITKIDNALEKVSKLSGNTYELETPNGHKHSAGLIAQEVQEVLPEAVTVDTDEAALLRLNYNAVIALLVESVKELKAEVEELKSKL